MDLSKVTRIEVIEEGHGRAYVKGATYGKPIYIAGVDVQDDERTLKIFIKYREPTDPETAR